MSTTLPQPTAQPKPTPAKSIWPRYPNLYEINTWVWLSDLSVKYGKPIDLASVPSAEWDAIAAYGFDAVWLMGVWERSPAGIAIANKNPGLLADFRRALPDFRPEDNVGSAYAIRRYVVDQHLGGPEALAAARNELVKRGMNLLLDFVPNHVAPDNPWASEHPDYFINGTTDEARNNPGAFISVNGIPSACGRDPYFAPWPDVLQLNAFNPKLRQAVIETLSSIAGQCDGVRCDMAMLVLNSVFERTWAPHHPPNTGPTSSPPSGTATPDSSSSPKPTGISSGSCSSSVSTSVTTKSYTTASNTGPPRACACTSAPTWPTRTSCSASSKITTNPARPRHSLRQRSVLLP
jgi:hypothetical protein